MTRFFQTVLGLLAAGFSLESRSQSAAIDVQHYQFQLSVNDQSDVLSGKAAITIRFPSGTTQFSLDLASVEDDKGMQAFSVKDRSSGSSLRFDHRNNKLLIQLPEVIRQGESRTFEIDYMGIPRDGLIISKNKYGDRTFFSDNWPDRAHQWLPCNDVPSDKASVEFEVTAPSHYRIISNGSLVKETVSGQNRTAHWKETAVIPTKVMVIGIARFAVARVDSAYRVPVTAWVYPQDSAKGVYDYALADDILRFFESYIGPYPYSKLANVQSKTIFGGMENANAIFYAENTVTGTRSSEDLIAHEIAHQWFGNTASEKSFTHLWLSEGFATYLTDLYIEQKYGRDSFNHRLEEERVAAVAFATRSKQPVVDSATAYMDLLNANSYQKGAWVLHMLRGITGDKTFRDIIRAYYEQFRNGNADTKDFQRVAEKVSGQKLDWFFEQWLYRPGIPELRIDAQMIGGELVMTIRQDKLPYRLDLDIHIVDADNTFYRERVTVEGKETAFKKKVKAPVNWTSDPDIRLLYRLKD